MFYGQCDISVNCGKSRKNDIYVGRFYENDFFMHILIFQIILHFVMYPRKFSVIFANWQEHLFLFVTKIRRKACTLIFLDKTQYCRRCLAQQYYRNTADFKHYQLYLLNAALRRSGFSVWLFVLFELTQDKITCTV